MKRWNELDNIADLNQRESNPVMNQAGHMNGGQAQSFFLLEKQSMPLFPTFAGQLGESMTVDMNQQW